MPETEYYVGLMSGTSVDGVDVALVEFINGHGRLLDYQTLEYPITLARTIHRLCSASEDELILAGQTDRAIGHTFAHGVMRILNDNGLSPDDITAIGSHGQTVRHYPSGNTGFTLQLGDANTIATTGIDVVADFRKKDVALGGQGAPLVPAFHYAMFNHPRNARAIINIGGISNITYLPGSKLDITGWDIGPGNTLMDAWCRQNNNKAYDKAGAWAASGVVDDKLLGLMLEDSYFLAPAPKSTGREHFNLDWLKSLLKQRPRILQPADIQATLLALTVTGIKHAVLALPKVDEVYICGGGSHNTALMEALAVALPDCVIDTTAAAGISPDCVEAMAFAWLAYAFKHKIPGNVPAVTGASSAAVLGGLYPGC